LFNRDPEGSVPLPGASKGKHMKRLTLILMAAMLLLATSGASAAQRTASAASAVTAKRFVYLAAAGSVAHATAVTNPIVGVCTQTQATTNGLTSYAAPGDVTTVTSGELIAVGNLLTGGTLGKAFVLDADDASTQYWGGIALTAASGADEDVTILVSPGVAEQRLALTSAAIGGGYGSTGVTISAAGVITANGAISSDGAVTGGSLTDGTATISSGVADTLTVDGDDNTVQDLGVTVPKAVTANAAIPFLVIFEPAAAGTTSYTVPVGKKLRVLDAWAFKREAAGAHADDDWNLQNNDGTAANIFDTEELNTIADKARILFDNLDDTEQDVAAGDTLDLVANEDAAGGCDGAIYVLCVWVTP